MLTEPDDLPAEAVLRLVQDHWDDGVRSAGFVPWGESAHWVCGGRRAPRWLVSADDVSDPATLDELETAYAAARRLVDRGLRFVVPTVAPESGGIGVRAGRYLVTLRPYLEGEIGSGAYADDNQRALIAGQLGQLHAVKPPRGCPRWQPGPGHRELLVHLLGSVDGAAWAGGPFGEPTRILLRGARSQVETLLARYDLLAATALKARQDWVVTHGEPHSANVLWSLGGPRLVSWTSVRLAPRERDLREVLRGAEGAEPLTAYVATGGTAELDADMVELFDLEWWLRLIGHEAARFAEPHLGDADEERCFEDLRAELSTRL